jgi:hypothetical protein
MSTERIRELNDEFRRTLNGGRRVVTRSVFTLPVPVLEELLKLITEFDTFGEGDDPYGEHDSGSVVLHGEQYFWKIDYYDREYELASPDPADPTEQERAI